MKSKHRNIYRKIVIFSKIQLTKNTKKIMTIYFETIIFTTYFSPLNNYVVDIKKSNLFDYTNLLQPLETKNCNLCRINVYIRYFKFTQAF